MSSLRNAVRRRPYKERAQPAAREHLGLLEKHKDYTLRAKDYNVKQKRVKALREKAAGRNPEEFYFKMLSSRTKDGVHQVGPSSKPIPVKAMRALKAQDAAYLGVRVSAERRRVQKLRDALHGFERPGGAEEGEGGAPGADGTHTIFVDSAADADAFDAAAHFGTAPELAGRRFNRLRTEALASETVKVPRAVRELAQSDPRALDRWVGGVRRQQAAAYAELEQRVSREARIRAEVERLELQRSLMGKGAVKKLAKRSRADGQAVVDGMAGGGGGGSGAPPAGRAVFKWKRERKR